MSKAQIRAGAASATLLLSCALLVGCLAPPSSDPGETLAVSPSPVSTSAVQTPPTSRFDVDCADVLSPQEAMASLGADVQAITRWPDRSTAGGLGEPFASALHVAMLQAGSLVCQWGVDDSTALLLIALPDAEQQFEQLVPAFIADPEVSSPFGETHRACATEGFPQCGFSSLIGSTWLYALYGPVAGVELTPDEFATLTDSASALVDTSTIADAWIPARASLDPAATCASLDSSGEAVADLTTSGYVQYISGAAVDAVGGLGCVIGTTELVVIPGGAWSWQAVAPFSNPSLALEKVPDLGDEAFAGCATSVCTADLISGGDRVIVTGQFASTEQLIEFVRLQLTALSL